MARNVRGGQRRSHPADVQSRGRTTGHNAVDQTTTEAVEEKVVEYAEDLGRMIGTVRARMDSWGDERQQLINQLSKTVTEAQALLTDLGHRARRQARRITGATGPKAVANEGGSRRKPGRVPKHTAGGPDVKRHRLPATTRRKMGRGNK